MLYDWEKRVDQRAERLMRGKRGLVTRLLASGTSPRQVERVLGLSSNTVLFWRGRGSYPRFANAMRLRALLRDLSRGLDLSRVPDGFYAGAERPNLSAWIDETVSDGWTMKGIAARSGVRPEAIRTVRRGGGISLPNGLRLAKFLKLARRGTLQPEKRPQRPAFKPRRRGGDTSRPYAGLVGWPRAEAANTAPGVHTGYTPGVTMSRSAPCRSVTGRSTCASTVPASARVPGPGSARQ